MGDPETLQNMMQHFATGLDSWQMLVTVTRESILDITGVMKPCHAKPCQKAATVPRPSH